jgi:hypothetical protein
VTRRTRRTARGGRSPASPIDVPSTRVRWARVVIAAALAAGILLAPRLFLATRAYPRVPVLDAWPPLGPPLDVAVVVALLAALVGVALAARPRWWAAAATVASLILAADDQSRWQPWFYQYTAMLAVLAVARDDGDTLTTWRVVLVGLYLWSGIQKLNATFMAHLFPWLVAPLAPVLPAGVHSLLLRGWIVAPLMEIAVAVGLVVPGLRNAAVVAAVLTHVVVLGLLGPLAHLTNAVVWPWNAALAVLAALLFWGDGSAATRVLVPRRLGPHAVALVLFGVLPVLSFSGRWDDYLSGALYSGNVKAAALSVSDAAVARLPDAARRHVTRNRAGANVLDVWEWSMGELAVPSYPEDRVFRAIARDVCRLAGDSSGVVLVIFGRPEVVSGHREITRTDCAAIERRATSRGPPPAGPRRQDVPSRPAIPVMNAGLQRRLKKMLWAAWSAEQRSRRCPPPST